MHEQSSTRAFDPDDRLHEAIASFELARDQGGEPDPKEWLARYPDVAARLAEFFVDQKTLGLLAMAAVPTAWERFDHRPASWSECRPSFPDYEIIEPIGSGGMGVVYKARQISANRIVALKVIRPDRLTSYSSEQRRQVIERFQTEAQAAAQIEHEHMVPIYHVGDYDGQPYYSMRFVEGPSLADLANLRAAHPKSSEGVACGTPVGCHTPEDSARATHASDSTPLENSERDTPSTQPACTRPLDSRRAARYLEQAARAVHEAHRHGILHRDLKPQNCLLEASTDRIYVMDFGLAKLVQGGGPERTRTGDIMGTPPYMSPEQARHAGQVTIASDVYSLGATLYALLTGRPPHQAEHPMLTLNKILEEEPIAPRKLQPTIPLDLETICLKCLEKNPAQRYADAEQLAGRLRLFLDNKPIPDRPVSTRERLWRWCRRNPLVSAATSAAALGVLLAVITFAVAFVVLNTRRIEAVKLANEKDALATKERDQRLMAEKLALDVRFDHFYFRFRDDPSQAMTAAATLLTEAARLEDRGALDSISLHLGAWSQEIHPLRGICSHAGSVWAVAFSPDSKILLTGGDDQTARLWDTLTGKPLGPPLQHQREIWAVAFSPDGKTVLTGSHDKTAQMWETATGKPLGPPMRHENIVWAVAFSPDGRTVVTGSGDKTARLWDAATSKPIGPPLQHRSSVDAVAFSPDGKTVLTGSRDNTAQLWETATGMPRGHPLQHQSMIYRAVFSPDGKSVLTGGLGQSAQLWETTTSKPLGPPLQHQGYVMAVAFSPDGRTVLTGSNDGTARLWEAATGMPLGLPLQHQAWVHTVAFSPDGKTVATGSWDRTARLWETATGKPLGPPLWHQDHVHRVAFSPDGKTVATASNDETVRLWETGTGKPLGQPLQHQGYVSSVAFNGDGKKLLTGGSDKTARVWETATGQPLGPPLQHQAEVYRVAFSPDGGTVLTGSEGTTARLWETDTGKPIGAPLQHRGRIYSVAFSPDGKTVLTGSYDKTARLWETATGQQLGPPLQHQGSVTAVAFSPDGSTLLTGSGDKTARLWNIAMGMPVGPPLRHQHPVLAALFSPDGKTVLTGGEDKTARLWDTATGNQLRPSLQHQGVVHCAAFSPDGKTVATGSQDTTARLWETATGKPLGPPLQHQGIIYSVAFSPDGKTVLTCSQDTARLWETATGKQLGLPLRHQKAVLASAYSPNGSIVLTGSFDKTARLWRVPKPIQGDPERILLWAQVITGIELDEYGGVRVLDAPVWQQRRQRLQKLGGPPVRLWRN